MSRKLPIAETAIQSIQFALGHIWPAIRLGWLPFLGYLALISAAFMLMMPGFFASFGALMDGYSAGAGLEALERFEMEIEAIEPNVARVVAGCLLMMLAWLIFVPLWVLLYRSAAGDIQMPGGFFYWNWGGREIRHALTIILYPIVLGIVMFAIMALAGGLSLASENSGDVTLGWVPVVLLFVAGVVMFWLFLRTFLIIPASAIDQQFNPFAVFMASGGNIFRLLGSFILIVLLLMACSLAFWIVMFIGTVSFGTLGMQFGSESVTGLVISLVSMVLLLGLYAVFAIATNLVTFGWLGGAWASLRKE